MTTVCPTSTQNQEKLNRYPGVAQLGARVVWDHQAAGSIPVTRTKFADSSAYQVGKITFIVTPVYKDEGEPMRDILLKLMLADLEPA